MKNEIKELSISEEKIYIVVKGWNGSELKRTFYEKGSFLSFMNNCDMFYKGLEIANRVWQ